MPALKARKPAKRTAKKKVAAKVKRARPALKTRSRRAPRAKKKVVVKRKVIPAHPDETKVTLGPHQVEHRPKSGGFRVHPAPVVHAIEYQRITLRHH